MQKIGDIKFVVKFEDGAKKELTAAEIANLNDKRRWMVLDSRGKVIMKKIFRGL